MIGVGVPEPDPLDGVTGRLPLLLRPIAVLEPLIGVHPSPLAIRGVRDAEQEPLGVEALPEVEVQLQTHDQDPPSSRARGDPTGSPSASRAVRSASSEIREPSKPKIALRIESFSGCTHRS